MVVDTESVFKRAGNLDVKAWTCFAVGGWSQNIHQFLFPARSCSTCLLERPGSASWEDGSTKCAILCRNFVNTNVKLCSCTLM